MTEGEYSPETRKLLKKADRMIEETKKNIEDIKKLGKEIETEMFIDKYDKKHGSKFRKYSVKEENIYKN